MRTLRSLALLIFIMLFLGTNVFAESQSIKATIFSAQSPLPFSLPSEDLFGGGLAWLQGQSLNQFCLLAVLLLGGLALSHKFFSVKNWERISILAIFLFSAVLCFKVVEGWDELYIGMRHAYSMVHTYRYSYNVHTIQEASVDFIPIFTSGLLGLTGLPLTETYMTLGLAGNLWLLILCWRFMSLVTESRPAVFFLTLALGLFPCVLFSSIAGFFSTVFCAAILTVFYLLYFSSHPAAKKRGLFLLSILTLFRVEGVFLAFLLWFYQYVICAYKDFTQTEKRYAALKQAVTIGFLLVLPFILSCVVRYGVYGHVIPPPVALKKAQGDFSYITNGFKYLQSTMFCYILWEIFVLTLPALCYGVYTQVLMRRFFAMWCILSVFIVPYILGGGDWFPVVWSRYFMCWIIASYFLWWSSWLVVAKRFITPQSLSQPIFALFLLLAPYLLHVSVVAPLPVPNGFGAARLVVHKTKVRWSRIDSLGLFGKFLDRTIPKDATIGCSEQATIMYYAQRDVVDFTGFTAKEVAFSKFDPFSPGNLLLRKRNPIMPFKYRPGVIAFWEMAETFKEPLVFSDNAERIKKYVAVFMAEGFRQNQIDSALYRAGSYEYLKALGYRFYILGTPKSVFFYWVHESIEKYHREQLQSLNIHQIGDLEVPYEYTPEFKERFSSGMEFLNSEKNN